MAPDNSSYDDIASYERPCFSGLPDSVLRPGGLTLTRRLVDYCGFKPGDRVVDIGCGSGVTVEYLLDTGKLGACGVDISERLLRQGLQRRTDLELVQADGAMLPFSADTVQGVLAECSLSVMPSAADVLREAGRILTGGGKIGITDIYWRHITGLPATAKSNGGILTRAGWSRLLDTVGMHPLVWEDHSNFLKQFVIQFIMRNGSADELWQCLTARQGFQSGVSASCLGYFLLVAEKPGGARPEPVNR